MKVFDLSCETDHVFEGWFASHAEFDQQTESGLLRCPVCDSPRVRRMPTATRFNLGEKSQSEMRKDATKMWLEAVDRIVASTEDVGVRFAEEARRQHYRETEARAIRGLATSQELRDLADEGIEVFSLPVPVAAKGPLQ